MSNCKKTVHRVGVFCSADDKILDQYKEEARNLGKAIALKGYHLVTGGSCTGLMNEVINGFTHTHEETLCATKGILPAIFKEYNIHHPEIAKENLVWTDNLYQRLQIFQEECDTLIILPGGFGTLHELMDFLVAKQFGIMNKKIILLNFYFFWDHLLEQFKIMVRENALQQKHLDLLTVVNTIRESIEMIQAKESSHDGLTDRFWEN